MDEVVICPSIHLLYIYIIFLNPLKASISTVTHTCSLFSFTISVHKTETIVQKWVNITEVGTVQTTLYWQMWCTFTPASHDTFTVQFIVNGHKKIDAVIANTNVLKGNICLIFYNSTKSIHLVFYWTIVTFFFFKSIKTFMIALTVLWP